MFQKAKSPSVSYQWPLEDKPFTAALLARHRASMLSSYKWAGIDRQPTPPPELSNAVVLAAGSLANEIASRASRQLQLPLLLPGIEFSRELYFVAVFHMLAILGLITNAKIEGVAVGGEDVQAAFVLSAMPLHRQDERVAVAINASKLVQEIVAHRSSFTDDLFKISRSYCIDVPAQDPGAPANFPSGVSADELFAVLLRHMLHFMGAYRTSDES